METSENLSHVIDLLLMHCDKRLLRSNLRFGAEYFSEPEMLKILNYVEEREARIKRESRIAASEPLNLLAIQRVWEIEAKEEEEQAKKMQDTILALEERQRERNRIFIKRARAIFSAAQETDDDSNDDKSTSAA